MHKVNETKCDAKVKWYSNFSGVNFTKELNGSLIYVFLYFQNKCAMKIKKRCVNASKWVFLLT
jgi:hypothetical protein